MVGVGDSYKEESCRPQDVSFRRHGEPRAAGSSNTQEDEEAELKRSPAPPGGRKRMPCSLRAKIFMPFDPLDGFSDALGTAERDFECKASKEGEHGGRTEGQADGRVL
jgi:hypothetical protein